MSETVAIGYKIIAPIDELGIKEVPASDPYHELQVQTWDQQENLEWPVLIHMNLINTKKKTHTHVKQEWRYVADPPSAALPDPLLIECITELAMRTAAMAAKALAPFGVGVKATYQSTRKKVEEVLALPPKRN